MKRREPENEERVEELAGAAMAILAGVEAERSAGLGEDRGAEAIWRRYAAGRAPRREHAERLERWLAWTQWTIGALAVLAGGAGWLWLRGLELFGEGGVAWSELAFSPALAVVAVGFAVLASALGITFGRWLEG